MHSIQVVPDVRFSVPERYENCQYIGHGSYGAVCSAYDTIKKRKVAIKKLLQPFRNGAIARRAFRELVLLAYCHHPCIIRIYDVYVTKNEEGLIDAIYIVMEYMSLTLHQAIREKTGKLTQDQISYIMHQLACGLKYLKSIGVMHRDLKPANIGINPETLETKILDFGLARSDGLTPQSALTPSASLNLTRAVVTLSYRAPEVMLSQNYDGYAIDIWSLGCILAEMCLGDVLFKAADEVDQWRKIVRELGPPPPEMLTMCSENIRIFLEERARSDSAKSEFINGIQSMSPNSAETEPSCSYSQAAECIREMLQYTTEKRMTVEKLLEHPFLQPYRWKDIEQDPHPEVLQEVRRELSSMDLGVSRQVNVWREKITGLLNFMTEQNKWSGSGVCIVVDEPDAGLDQTGDGPPTLSPPPIMGTGSFGSHLTVFSPIIGVLGYLAAARYFPHLSLRRHLSVGALVGFTALTAARILVHSSSPR